MGLAIPPSVASLPLSLELGPLKTAALDLALLLRPSSSPLALKVSALRAVPPFHSPRCLSPRCLFPLCPRTRRARARARAQAQAEAADKFVMIQIAAALPPASLLLSSLLLLPLLPPWSCKF